MFVAAFLPFSNLFFSPYVRICVSVFIDHPMPHIFPSDMWILNRLGNGLADQCCSSYWNCHVLRVIVLWYFSFSLFLENCLALFNLCVMLCRSRFNVPFEIFDDRACPQPFAVAMIAKNTLHDNHRAVLSVLFPVASVFINGFFSFVLILECLDFRLIFWFNLFFVLIFSSSQSSDGAWISFALFSMDSIIWRGDWNLCSAFRNMRATGWRLPMLLPIIWEDK